MPKYLSQRPIFDQPQPMFLPQCERPNYTPIHNYSSLYIYTYFFFFFFWGGGSKLEDKRFCTQWQHAFPDFSLPSFVSMRYVRMFTAVLSICTAVMTVKVLWKCCCTVLWCVSNSHSKSFMQYIGCARYVTCLVCRVGLYQHVTWLFAYPVGISVYHDIRNRR
jgi:hypothetical protein